MVLGSNFTRIRSLTRYIAITKLVSLCLDELLLRCLELLLTALIKIIEERILKRLWLKLYRVSLVGRASQD